MPSAAQDERRRLSAADEAEGESSSGACRARLIRAPLLLCFTHHAIITAAAVRRMRLAAGALARRALRSVARAVTPAVAATPAPAPAPRAYATLTTEQARSAARRLPGHVMACFPWPLV